MKNIRTKIVMVVILTGFILFCGGAMWADTVTLKVAFPGAGLPRTDSFEVPSNVVAQIVFANLNNASIYESYPQSTAFSSIGSGLILVGPATITLTNTANTGTPSICTIQTSSASPASFTPSSSVVIPNDNGGPVTIILESSTDLINWTAANPGTYGTTSSNRFFRVRAQR